MKLRRRLGGRRPVQRGWADREWKGTGMSQTKLYMETTLRKQIILNTNLKKKKEEAGTKLLGVLFLLRDLESACNLTSLLLTKRRAGHLSDFLLRFLPC